jgi:hypothetical protein
LRESELTEAQRESREPIGEKGYYRMYKWYCRICDVESNRLPYSEAMYKGLLHVEGFQHKADVDNPPVRVIGGVFPKELLYT